MIYHFSLAKVKCTRYCFTSNCKQSITSLSLLIGTTIAKKFSILLTGQILTFPHQKYIFKVILMSFDQLNQTFVLNHYWHHQTHWKKNCRHLHFVPTHLSREMWFPTTWHFDKCRLRRACVASFKLRNSKLCLVSSSTIIEYSSD